MGKPNVTKNAIVNTVRLYSFRDIMGFTCKNMGHKQLDLLIKD